MGYRFCAGINPNKEKTATEWIVTVIFSVPVYLVITCLIRFSTYLIVSQDLQPEWHDNVLTLLLMIMTLLSLQVLNT